MNNINLSINDLFNTSFSVYCNILEYIKLNSLDYKLHFNAVKIMKNISLCLNENDINKMNILFFSLQRYFLFLKKYY